MLQSKLLTSHQTFIPTIMFCENALFFISLANWLLGSLNKYLPWMTSPSPSLHSWRTLLDVMYMYYVAWFLLLFLHVVRVALKYLALTMLKIILCQAAITFRNPKGVSRLGRGPMGQPFSKLEITAHWWERGQSPYIVKFMYKASFRWQDLWFRHPHVVLRF